MTHDDEILSAVSLAMAEPEVTPKRFRRIKYDECRQNYVEVKGDICEGCDAYREHTGAI